MEDRDDVLNKLVAAAYKENAEFLLETRRKFPKQHPTFDTPFLPPSEPVTGKTYRADGWAYFDIPGRFAPEMWEYLLSAFGENETHILTMTCGSNADGPWVRGQILVSPQGIENSKAFRNKETPV